MTRDELLDHIAARMMLGSGGFSPDKTISPIEWDPDQKDGQFSLNRETAEEILDILDNLEDVGNDAYLKPLTGVVSPTATTYSIGFGGGGGSGSFSGASLADMIHNQTIYWPNTSGPATPVEPAEPVTTTATISVRLRKNATLADIQEFADRLYRLGVAEDAVISGDLSYTLTLDAEALKVSGELHDYSIFVDREDDDDSSE
mgnify:FL=1